MQTRRWASGPLARFFPAAVLLLVVAWSLRAAVAPVGRVAQQRSCERAATIDGRLMCDEEVPADIESLCALQGVNVRAAGQILGGDTVETAQVCARLQARPGMHATAERRRAPGWGRMSGPELQALSQLVEVNTASTSELRSLPRVGPAIARRIVEGRPYREVDDLIEVRGIGPVTLQGLRPRVIVEKTDP